MNVQRTIVCIVLAGFMATTGGCTKNLDLTGMWHGTMTCPDSRWGGTADVEAALQQTPQGINGSITWKNTTGAWSRIGASPFVISSGVVGDKQVSIIAGRAVGLGANVTMNLKGNWDGHKLLGTLDLSFSGGLDQFSIPGTFELQKN